MTMLRRAPAPLAEWINEHMPELAARLGPMSLENARQILNEVTGLNVQGYEKIESTYPLFLEALKRQKGET